MSANLNDAAMAGNVEEVLMRLNMGEDVNQKCYPRYSTPLHDATCCGRTEVVRILLDRGANVNELDYKNSTPLKLASRYGQDDITALLEAAGALNHVDPPKKTSVVGVDPPWVRKSSRVSRREEIAGCDGEINEFSCTENMASEQHKKKVKIKISDESGVIELEMDQKTKEAIELEEKKIKAIQMMENIVEVKTIKDKSPKQKLDSNDEEVKNVFEKANLETPWLVKAPQMKHLHREVSEAKDSEIQGANLFLRNSPETTIGNLLEKVPNVNRYTIHVSNIQKYLRPDIEAEELVENPNFLTMPKPREILKNVILEKSPSKHIIPVISKPNEILTSTVILEKSPENKIAPTISMVSETVTPTDNVENGSETVEHTKEPSDDKRSPNNTTSTGNIINTKSLEKQKVKNKFSSYQMKLAEKAKASEAIKDEVKSNEPDNQKLKIKQNDKTKDTVKTKPSTNQKINEMKPKVGTTAAIENTQVKAKQLIESKAGEKKNAVKIKPSTYQKTNEMKIKEKPKVTATATIEKTQIKSKQLIESKAAEKKAPNLKQMDSKTIISKQQEKQAPTSKHLKTQAKPTIHSDTALENTKQQIKVTKIQTYLRPKPGDESLGKDEEKTAFENLQNIKKVEVTGQNKSGVEARYIKLSAEREEEETSILESLESRRLKEELMPLGLGVAARNAAEMGMQFEGKQPMEIIQTGVEEIMEEIILEKQNETADKSLYKTSEEERAPTPTGNKVELTKQALKEKCKSFGIFKGVEEKKEDEENIPTNLSDQGIEKTKQALKESWQKVKEQKTKIGEGKHTITKQLDDKLGLTQKWSKIYKQKTNKSSLEEEEKDEEKEEEIDSNKTEKLTEDQIKEQQAIIRKILEECVMLEQKKQQQNIEQNLEDHSIDIEQAETILIENEDMNDDTILINKKLTLSEKVEEHLKLKQKWENICKLKENIKEKVSKKGDEKDEKQISESFHKKTKNAIKQKIEKLSCVASTEIEEPQENEEIAEPVEEQARTGWFIKEEVSEKEESIQEKNDVETKVPQLGWFNKVGSLETESSLSMVGSPDTKLFNEVSLEQKEATSEETNEIDSNSQQFGWFSSAMDSEPVESEQETPKEAQKGLKQKWGKCRSVVNSVMRPMK